MLKDIKKKYVRSVIKLGNSKAITFPQEWTNIAKLNEKSEVSLFPIDEKTIVIRTIKEEKQKSVFKMDGNEWPIKLIRQALISAFKLDIDEIYLKYDNKNQEELYEILIDLRNEIIGIDFKDLTNTNEYYINFLLDASKTNFPIVLMDLANVFNTIIKNVVNGSNRKNKALLLAEIDRKYSLGTRILITGLSEYPLSKIYRNLPVIRFLGDRIILLYTRDFINEALNLQNIHLEIIKKYSTLLIRIPKFLIDIIKNYNEINLSTISEFQDYLKKLHVLFDDIKFDVSSEEQQIRNYIKYYLNSFNNFLDIGITRMIEIDIGMA
ncbi:MAG: AbrB/MazE/SpoVT family DNA-binding domain-containing protein [Promethearchaeota archaeon]